jgi:hypothetical protein
MRAALIKTFGEPTEVLEFLRIGDPHEVDFVVTAAWALSYPSAASQSGRIPSSSRVLMTRRGVPRSRQATADNRMTASV